MIAGTLEVQMMANLVRLSNDMNQAKSMVGSAMSGIERSVGLAKTALGALGIGLGIGYFVNLVRESIDAADHLNDLSKATRISVEDLSGLKLAAKQSGSDLDSIAQSIQKLGQNIGKEPEKYRALGITARTNLGAFKQMSDLFIRLENDQQRNAVMAEALGKSWQGAAPMLSEGSRKIQEMIDKGKSLSGMTKQLAEDSDEFKDKMAELNFTLEGTRTKAIGPLLPGLNNIAAAMGEAAKEGGLLLAAWVGLGGAAELLTKEMRKLLGLPSTEIAALERDLANLQKSLAGMSSSVDEGVKRRLQEQMGVIQARLNLLRHEERQRQEAGAKPGPIHDQPSRAEFEKAEALAAAFLANQKAVNSALAALRETRIKNEIEALDSELRHKQQLLDHAHQQNELSDRAYYAQKVALAKEAADAEVAALNFLLGFQKQALAQTKQGTEEYYKALKDVVETEAKRAKITREFGHLTALTLAQAAQAADNYKRSVEQVNIQLLELTGQTAKAAAAQAELQNREFRKKAVAEGDLATVAKIDLAGRLTAARAEFTEENEKLSAVNARLQMQEERIQNTLRTGAISELDALVKTGKARAVTIGQQEAIVANLQRIAEASGNPALVLQAEQAAAAIEKLRGETDLLGEKINTVFAGAAADAWAEFRSGAKSGEEAIKSFGDAVVKQIDRMVMEALSKKLFGALGMGPDSSGAGGIGGWLSSLFGGGAGRAMPGFDPGFTGTAIPMAAGGDFLVTRPTLFLAGEAGTERATFTPQGAAQGDSGGITIINHFYGFSGDKRSQAQVAAAAAEGVQRALRRNG